MANPIHFQNQSDMIVAIDFGTIYIKYAYSVRQYRPNNLEEEAKIFYSDIKSKANYRKVPAIILFKPDLTFDSLGYEAERKYSELILHNKHHTYYYFQRFKMQLFKTKNTNRGLKLIDTNGKYLPARMVVSAIFLYIKACVHNVITLNRKAIPENTINWMLNLPDYCNEENRQLMRECATLAGIHDGNLSFIDESEAIIFYCENLPVQYFLHTTNDDVADRTDSNSVMVLNLGGGESYSSVYNISADGEFVLRHQSREIINGEGTQVDNAFLDFLLNIFPSDVWLKFKANHQDDYIEIFRKFEIQKRKISPHTKGCIILDIPFSLTSILRREKELTLNELVLKCKIESKFITVVNKNIKVLVERFQKLFKEVNDSITEHVKTATEEGHCNNTDTILMVGGFSKSNMLQYLVRNAFPDNQVIVPSMAEFAALKGYFTIDHNQPECHPRQYLTYTNARMMRRSNPFIERDKKPKPLEVYAVLDIGSTYSGCAYALNSDCKDEQLPVVATVKWIGGNDIFWPKTPTTLLLKVIDVKPIIPRKETTGSTIKQKSGQQHSVSFEDEYYEILEIDDETQRYSSAVAPSDESDDSDTTPYEDRDTLTQIPEESLLERSNMKLDTENFLFGFEAEDEHYKFEDPNTYRYFPKFLTQITTLTRETKVKDSYGAEILASELFSLVILFLKRKIEHIVMFNKRLPVRKHNFKWILTVPSVWNDEAKDVIQEAATKAGLLENQFRLVPDMAAISMYCNAVFEEDVKSIKRNEDILILDLGGGHIDTAVMVFDGMKRHLVCSREQIGGDAIIESAVKQYLTKEFGRRSMKHICRNADYLRTLRSFDKTLDSVSRINSTPRIFVPPLVRQSNAQTDKLMIPNEEFSKIFYSYIDQVTEHIESLLNNDIGEDRRVGIVFMVGGLSVTHRQIREGLSDAIDETRVCVPGEAVTCVMTGGIMCCYKDEFATYNIIQSASVPEVETNVVSGSDSITNYEARQRPPPSYSSVGRKSGSRNHRHGKSLSASNSSRSHSLITTPSFEEPPSYSSVGQASGMNQESKKIHSYPIPDIDQPRHGAFASETSLKRAPDLNDMRYHQFINGLGSRSSLQADQHPHDESSNIGSQQIGHRSRVHPSHVHRRTSQSLSRRLSNQAQVSDNGQSSCCQIL